MDYFVMPIEIAKRTDLKANEKLVLALIRALDNSEKHCYASNQFIADQLGLKKQTVANIVTKFSKLNVLKVIIKNFNERTIIYLGRVIEETVKKAKELANTGTDKQSNNDNQETKATESVKQKDKPSKPVHRQQEDKQQGHISKKAALFSIMDNRDDWNFDNIEALEMQLINKRLGAG